MIEVTLLSFHNPVSRESGVSRLAFAGGILGPAMLHRKSKLRCDFTARTSRGRIVSHPSADVEISLPLKEMGCEASLATADL